MLRREVQRLAGDDVKWNETGRALLSLIANSGPLSSLLRLTHTASPRRATAAVSPSVCSSGYQSIHEQLPLLLVFCLFAAVREHHEGHCNGGSDRSSSRSGSDARGTACWAFRLCAEKFNRRRTAVPIGCRGKRYGRTSTFSSVSDPSGTANELRPLRSGDTTSVVTERLTKKKTKFVWFFGIGHRIDI